MSSFYLTHQKALEVFLHIKFTDMLREGEITLDPVKQHLTKKERKKLTKKQYKVFEYEGTVSCLKLSNQPNTGIQADERS